MTTTTLNEIACQSDRVIKHGFPETGVPGASFLALSRDGSTIYSNHVGTLSQGNKLPITDESIFWIASATKVLTAICTVKLVDQGLIGLDDNVLPYLPDLERQQVRHAFMTPEFKLVPREGEITVRQLLTCTAGVSYPVVESMAAQLHSIPTGSEPFMPADKSSYVGPLDCQPGTKWAYSGAFDWLGELIKAVSGLPLGEYLSKHILEPSGISSKDITFELTPEQQGRLAGAHFRWPDGTVTSRGKIYSDDVAEHLGGMGAYATISAFTRVLLPLLNDGKHPSTGNQILKPELVREMFKPQLNEQQRAWLDMPTVANAMQVLLPGVEKQWGLGFLLMTKGGESGRGANTATWAGFANTHWIVDPTNGVIMTVFAQIIPQEDPKLLEVRDAWESVVFTNMKAANSNPKEIDTQETLVNGTTGIAVEPRA